MFGIGGFELFIILVFGFLLFGPDKLPEIAKTVGKGIARFREAQQEMNDTIGGEKIFDPNNPDEPFKDPVEVLDRIAKKQEEKKAGKEKAGSTSTSTSKPKPAAKATATTSADDAASADTNAEQGRQETFTERKARYERERAARKAAEEKAAAEATQAAGSATQGGEATSDQPAPSEDAPEAPVSEGGDE